MQGGEGDWGGAWSLDRALSQLLVDVILLCGGNFNTSERCRAGQRRDRVLVAESQASGMHSATTVSISGAPRFKLSRGYQDPALAITKLTTSRQGVEFRTSLVPHHHFTSSS